MEEASSVSRARVVLRGVMNTDSIAMRVAKPTFEEGLVFARYLDEAFESFIRTMLGQRFTAIVATAHAQTDHDFSYKNTIFAVRDKAIVGMICGYTAEQHRRSSDQPLKQAAGNSVLQKIGVAILCARLRLLGTHADGDFYIQAFAVDRELRGQGIGSTLMDCIEDRARSSGSRRLSLDVVARNKSARRLYERRGFTVESGWRDKLRIPRFIIRMTKPL